MRNTNRNRPKSTTRQAKPRVKTRSRADLDRSKDDTDVLYCAVQKYVENRGESLKVIGGIETQEWPNDPKFCFKIAIKCVGRKPDFVNKNGK